MSAWIKCSDRLPAPDVEVLIFYTDVREEGGGFYLLGKVRHHGRLQPHGYNGDFSDNVTHWQPLTAPDESRADTSRSASQGAAISAPDGAQGAE